MESMTDWAFSWPISADESLSVWSLLDWGEQGWEGWKGYGMGRYVRTLVVV